MDTFEFDLDDLDLKSVDINNTSNSRISPNPSFNSNRQINLGNDIPNSYTSSQPNLTISSSNNDPMPPNTFSTDRAVDFGLDLIVNKKKQRTDVPEINKLGSNGMSRSAPSSPAPMSFSGNQSSNDFMPQQMSDTELLQNNLFDDGLTNIDLDKEFSSIDIDDIKKPSGGMSGPGLPNFGSSSSHMPSVGAFNNSSYASENNGFMGNGINTGGVSSTSNLSYEDIQKAKFDLICKFERLRDKGVRLPKNFSMSSDYEEMKYEYDRLVHQRKMANSVKMQRHALITFVSGVEFLNNKFDPFDLKLDNWSENVNDNITDYDDVFEELYEKYKESANMAPELKLLFMVAGSGFMYHLSNSMFKSAMPSANDVLKQNPDLMNQFKSAALGAMSGNSPGFANFMGAMGGGGGVPKYNPMGGPPFSNPRDAPPRGATNINNTDDIDQLLENMN